ncbi:MAG: hypothetical protein Q8O01_01950, partial [Candidatus Omnitrophota bacterium]|nr:hypothetical protein [Candidatus Omnitrophota bacterium]
MKTIKILLALCLIFQNITDFGYAGPLTTPLEQGQSSGVMGVGYQTQQQNAGSGAQQNVPSINIPGRGYANPAAVAIADTGATAEATSTSRGLSLNYNTGTRGWVGGGFDYGNTPADFSAITDLIVGLKGSPSRVKFELKDSNDKSSFVYLDSIKPDVEQLWKVPLDYFRNNGVDLSKVKMINCIVEGTNKTGTLEFNRSMTPMWISPSSVLTFQDINLPTTGVGYPGIMGLAVNPNNAKVTLTDRGVSVNYDTGADGWAGCGFVYDDLSTSSSVEYFNLKASLGSAALVIGLKGNSPQVKMEIVDSVGNKSSVKLDGIESSQEKIWSVSLDNFQGVDLTKVSYVYFIAEGKNKTGIFEVNRLPTSMYVSPDATKSANDINIPTEGLVVPAGVVVNPSNATAVLTETGRGISVA